MANLHHPKLLPAAKAPSYAEVFLRAWQAAGPRPSTAKQSSGNQKVGFIVTGELGGRWTVDLASECIAASIEPESEAIVCMTQDALADLLAGRLSVPYATQNGLLAFWGNRQLLEQLSEVLRERAGIA